MPIIATGAKNRLAGIHADIEFTEITLKTALNSGQILSAKTDKNWQPCLQKAFVARNTAMISTPSLFGRHRHNFCIYDDRN